MGCYARSVELLTNQSLWFPSLKGVWSWQEWWFVQLTSSRAHYMTGTSRGHRSVHVLDSSPGRESEAKRTQVLKLVLELDTEAMV